MGFDLRYNFINTFRTVDNWRNNILLNAQGGLLPGFKQRRTHLGMQQAAFHLDPGAPGRANLGARAPLSMTAGELTIQRTALQHRQDPLMSADGSFTTLGIQGDGFFAVAESLSPGARVMLTRDGSFHWKQTGVRKNAAGEDEPIFHLVNSQGLYALRAGDIEALEGDKSFMTIRRLPSPDTQGIPDEKKGPPGMISYRDGTVTATDLDPRGKFIKGIATYRINSEGTENLEFDGQTSQLAIIRVPNQADLNISSFGPTVYNFSLSTLAGSTVRTVTDYYREVNPGMSLNGTFPVVGNRLEQADAQVSLQLAILENQTADFVFKNLSTMLQEYNNAQDQLLNLIR